MQKYIVSMIFLLLSSVRSTQGSSDNQTLNIPNSTPESTPEPTPNQTANSTPNQTTNQTAKQPNPDNSSIPASVNLTLGSKTKKSVYSAFY